MSDYLKKLNAKCDDFNNAYPVGTKVFLKKDFIDEPVTTTVRAPAFLMCNEPVAFFDGISGSYGICCVKGLAAEVVES